MDTAVSLVETYLRVNGYLTVAEYPILHDRGEHGFQEVTDIDVLAHRFPEAGRVLPRGRMSGQKVDADPVLDITFGRGDMVLAEVKEGRAGLNPAWRRPAVLYEALRRFGVVRRAELRDAARQLADDGVVVLDNGDRIRILTFGSRPPRHDPGYISMGQVIEFMEGYVAARLEMGDTSHFRDPVLAFFGILAKARQA